MSNSHNFELLTLDEYANRFGVCRTTIFEWKKKGILKSGRHFISIGKVLRFFWDIDALREIHSDNQQNSEGSDVQSKMEIKSYENLNTKSPINFEY